ncbi:MAG: LptF/LptG family permease, partial [Polaribacter sp.]
MIPIAIAIDISEKIDNFLEHPNLGFNQVVEEYYVNFTIYYANTFMPLALFIAVILFTSKLSNNTEVIAITNAKISFTRFLYPYFIGATLITIISLGMNHFVVPNSSKTRKKFEKEFINSTRQKNALKYVSDFSLQLTDSTYIFIRSYNTSTNSGYDFTSETYDGLKLKSKFSANSIRYNTNDSTFTLLNWRKLLLYKKKDSIFSGNKIDTVLTFTP